MVAFYQGEIFKSFKEKEKFQEMVKKLKIHKSTIIFKINVFKLIEKYPKLMRSSIILTFLKNYLKDIKKVCEDNLSDFKRVKAICLSLQNFLQAYVTSRRENLFLTNFC